MKKIVFLYVAILCGVYIFFVCLDWNGAYGRQRELWLIERAFKETVQDKENPTNYELEKSVKQFRRYVKKHSKTRLAARAQLSIGQVYMIKKDFKQARNEFIKVAQVYDKDKEFLAQAQANIAESYQNENNWPQALNILQSIIKQYPLTPTGFSIPIYIAKYYEVRNLKVESMEAFERAAQFYTDIGKKNAKKSVEFDALRMIVYCRLAQSRWSDALNALREMILKFPTGSVLNESLQVINNLAVMKLHDYDRAISIYNEFLMKYPKHPAADVVKRMLQGLNSLKKSGTLISTKPL